MCVTRTSNEFTRNTSNDVHAKPKKKYILFCQRRYYEQFGKNQKVIGMIILFSNAATFQSQAEPLSSGITLVLAFWCDARNNGFNKAALITMCLLSVFGAHVYFWCIYLLAHRRGYIDKYMARWYNFYVLLPLWYRCIPNDVLSFLLFHSLALFTFIRLPILLHAKISLKNREHYTTTTNRFIIKTVLNY